MNPVDKALWYIESHSEKGLSLDAIADAACVSKYHLLRAFQAATGLSVMRYLRGRRLSRAAERLAAGAPDILAVAVDCGYGSHEAFTRAFREMFGKTPEAIREQRHLHDVSLLPAITLERGAPMTIDPPRFVETQAMLVAGIAERYQTGEAGARIPEQWQRFSGYLGGIHGQVGSVTYGVCYNTDDEGGMDYLCGAEVSDFGSLPATFSRLRLAPSRYAVFWHGQHVSAIRGTWNVIWNEWLPNSGHRAVDAPLFERYDERFNPRSGAGGVELWVPIE